MKKKGLKKARSIGKRARENLSTEFLQGDNSTTEEQLKQMHTASRWTSLTKGQEDHYDLKVIIRIIIMITAAKIAIIIKT